MNPLDSMTWEQRFWAAHQALLHMEVKFEDAMAELTARRIPNKQICIRSKDAHPDYNHRINTEHRREWKRKKRGAKK